MKIFLSLHALLCLLPFAALAQNPELTYEEWRAEAAKAQKREQSAKEAIAQEQSKSEAVKEDISQTAKNTERAHRESYEALKITDDSVAAWHGRADALVSRLQGLLSLAPGELLKRVGEFQEVKKDFGALKENNVARLFAGTARVAEIENLLLQIKTEAQAQTQALVEAKVKAKADAKAEAQAAAEAKAEAKAQSRLQVKEKARTADGASDKAATYTVRRVPGHPDNLWRIAASPEVYNDPFQWRRIYEANKEKIDQAFHSKNQGADPKYKEPKDLILPGMVLDIPR